MAEVYWDLEWTMLQQGFDYAYDKRLYDRLHESRHEPVPLEGLVATAGGNHAVASLQARTQPSQG